MKKPLAALLVSAAALALVASPAGAASSKNNSDWTRQVIPCRTGHKSAVIGYSPTHPAWLGSDDSGSGIPNSHAWASYFKNPCKGQWLVFSFWHGDPSEDSNTTVSAATGTAGKTDAGVTGGQLLDAPVCDVQGADRDIVTKSGDSIDGATPYCP